MKREYLQFTPEELIDNSEFIAWVHQGKNQEEWELLINENSKFRSTVYEARNIIGLLEDTEKPLKAGDKLKIWKNIERFDRMNRNHQQIKIGGFLRYAAVLMIALAIGSAGYWVSYQNQKSFIYTKSGDAGTVQQSQLILSDGSTVNLEKNNSKITLKEDQKIVVDNEKVIDLSTINSLDESKMNEIVIPFGKKSQLVLEDGTKVWLNAGSRMAFPTKFTGKKREVFLEGEAYFEVVHNQNLPFLVNTGEIQIKVLGTKFDLSAYKSDNTTETVLIEGKVAISQRSTWGFLKKETILTPNQRGSFSRSENSLTVKNEPDVESSTAWKEGWFKFNHQSVNNVLNQLQRYYNVEFEVGDEFSTADVITGKLDLKDSIEKVMIVMADVANIKYRIDGNKIYIDKE